MEEQERERRKKLEKLRKEEQESPYSLEKVSNTEHLGLLIKSYGKESREWLEKNTEDTKVVGRVISIRLPFCTIREEWNDFQMYFPKDSNSYAYFEKYVDVGDFIFARGRLFKTKLQVLTLRAEKVKLITKSLNPFPDQYYGIKDKELQLRNRVTHCLVDKEVFNTFQLRSRIIWHIRSFLHQNSYMEVETPILQSIYGGATAEPFKTYYESLKSDFFLRIAPELPLKKLIIAGFPKVFEIGKVFRNEGIDSTHNPEFTSLEIYTVNHGLEEVMNLTEQIFQEVAKELKCTNLNWNGYEDIDLTKPFKRVRISELLSEKLDEDFYKSSCSLEKALKLEQEHLLELKEDEKSVGNIIHKLFEKYIEKDLIQPTFVTYFHKDVSPLAKSDPNNQEFTLRYELYIGGKEFANGFAELNDPDDQLERFKQQREEVDYDYINAMKYGLPPTGGIGIGIDRLVMLFTQKNSIKDVIFFPHLKK
ncbi:lysine--tRNA ligase [Candidatus Mycoplasma haematobovis]|uniref:Lysine--tRNA ligase n=1 Tax=Candidatus Mycoplasma haematobovis TaxID=432608 RepID=A0A1A9QCM8_9MOLU|nr:lysine--tRNA ligase [Candidatus Mycoplasma haematobovis]OAL10203.1 lysine--tRNA ligase [Candidatus Mycoplasma haematobovis]